MILGNLFDPAVVFESDPLPNITPEQELQSARDKIAPAMRELIVRQNKIVETSGFSLEKMNAAALEITTILALAEELGIDNSENGLDLDETIQSSLAFPTVDQQSAETSIRLLLRQRDDAIAIDNSGQCKFHANSLLQYAEF